MANDGAHAELTSFAILRHRLSLSSRVDWNHSGSVFSVRVQVLQHSVVGVAWYLDLDGGAIGRHVRLGKNKEGNIIIIIIIII